LGEEAVKFGHIVSSRLVELKIEEESREQVELEGRVRSEALDNAPGAKG
jgi:hypothetical protein